MNKRKSIMILIPQLNFGGMAKVASHIVGVLSEKVNITIVLVNSTLEIREKTYGADIKRLQGNPITKLIQLRRFIRDNNFDDIVSFGTIDNILNVLLRKASSRVILTEHSVKSFENVIEKKRYKKYLYGWLIKLLYPKADVVVAVSSGIADDLAESFNVKSNVKVIYNPVFISNQQQTLNEDEYKLITNIRNLGGKILVNVGRVTDAKGQYNLVRSMKYLPSNMHLLIIGEGDDAERVKRLVSEERLTDRVHFLGYKTNVSAWMEVSDRYVSMSWFEGFPTVFIESIKSGTPVVSADVYAGPREILSNGFMHDYGVKIDYPKVLQNGVLSNRFNFTKVNNTGMDEAEKAFANSVIASFDYEFNLDYSFLNITDVRESYLEIL